MIATLKQARELISNEAHWTQEAGARDKAGRPIVDYDKAESYCLLGCVDATANGNAVVDRFIDEMNRYCQRHYGMSAVRFNDTHSHSEVLGLFDNFIKEAEQHESNEV